MTERINVSRNAFLVAAIAAVLTFSALWWVGNVRERELSLAEKPVALASHKMQATTPPAAPVAPASRPLVDPWVPSPAEFVKLTTPVAVHNSRGEVVKEFPIGKRLRVSQRADDKITINYLGDDYTIAIAATEPSQ
jgi:hypothetical protein